MNGQELVDAQYDAAMHVIARTGCRQFDLHADEGHTPTVWTAVGSWAMVGGVPSASGALNAHRVGAAFDPLGALLDLCEKLLDGGLCAHCQRPCGFDESLGHDPMPAEAAFCWIQWDPELRLFRAGCGFTYRPIPRTEGEPG